MQRELLNLFAADGSSSEDVVPKRRADAEPVVLVHIVMAQMMALQPLPKLSLHRSMMRGVVDRVIADVPKQKAGKEQRQKSLGHQHVKQTVKEQGEGHAY